MKEKNELKSLLIVFLNFTIALLWIWLFIIHLDILSNPFKTIFPYLFTLVVLLLLCEKAKNKYLKFVFSIILVIIALPVIPIFYTFKYAVISVGIFFYCIISSIMPLILYRHVLPYCFSNINTSQYITLTAIMFIAYVGNKQVLLIMYQLPKKLKKYYLLKEFVLIRYILQMKNVRGFIYLAYFLLLFASNIYSSEGANLFGNINNETVIKSLVTFIAFDRAYSVLKDLKIQPSKTLERLKQRLSD